jgi:hypothetical protein
MAANEGWEGRGGVSSAVLTLMFTEDLISFRLAITSHCYFIFSTHFFEFEIEPENDESEEGRTTIIYSTN